MALSLSQEVHLSTVAQADFELGHPPTLASPELDWRDGQVAKLLSEDLGLVPSAHDPHSGSKLL